MANPDTNTDLLKYVALSIEHEKEFHFLRFESLQRTNIVAQQVRLNEIKLKLHNAQDASAEDLEDLKNTLKDYTSTIRDYQFLRSRKKVAREEMHARRLLVQACLRITFWDDDASWSQYAYFDEKNPPMDPVRDFLRRKLPVYFTYSGEERSDKNIDYHDGKAPEGMSSIVNNLARFLQSITGGLFLIVPMLIMAFDTSQKKSLITVSLSVFLFALTLSFGFRTTNIEALISTATYAAVLVVFVGTNSGDGGTVTAASNSTMASQ